MRNDTGIFNSNSKMKSYGKVGIDMPVQPLSFEIELQAVCEAYRGADNYVAYYGMRMDLEAKRIVASSRDRFYAQLRPLLAQLVARM